jgi:hypothetical protein
MTPGTLGPNLIRTYVPVVVGSGISWLISHGIQVTTPTKAALIALLTSTLIAGYYTVLRVLEERWPSIGLLLGARQPGLVQAAVAEWPEDDRAWPPRGTPAVPPHDPPAAAGPASAAFVPTVHVAPPAATGSLADLVNRTPEQPVRRRGPATGAIPRYTPPPGR